MKYKLLSSFFVEPEWNQFWPSMIATFVGFVLALLGQFAWERWKEKHDAKGLISRIKSELGDVITVLTAVTDTSLEAHPLKTLVWDEAINAGQVSLLKPNIRAGLFVIYKQIQEFNSWFLVKTNYYFEHNGVYNQQLNDELAEQKKILLGEISKESKSSINSIIAKL